MKKIASEKSQKFLESLLPLPLFLTMGFSVLFLLGGLLFFIYTIVLTVALKSAMAFLLAFAITMISIGFGLLLLHGFFVYKKYYADKKSGIVPQKPQKSKDDKTFKDFLTLQNVSLVILLLGAVFAIISALLGALNRDKWVNAISPYMEKNGYYSDVEYREYRYISTEADGVNGIIVDLDGKQAVVIYTEDAQRQGFIIVGGYDKYENQIQISKNARILTITEGENPRLDGALEKMLFFMFDENEIEKQVKIYIPLSMKDIVKITGDYIEAKY